MTQDLEKRARRPRGHGGAVTNGACEGWQASPLIPNRDNVKSEILRCRLAPEEFDQLKMSAQNSGQSMAELTRQALGLVQPKRALSIPNADPALLRKLAGIGNNLNQIARHLNREIAVGNIRAIDGVALAAQLLVIERLLVDKIDEVSQ